MENKERLLAVAKMIGKVRVLADVGCDHAYLAIYMIESALADRAIISDINYQPLENAKSNIHKAELTSKISARLGAGLEPYKDGEVDVFVIAGMGGRLISEIISNSMSKARTAKFLVLQPMQQKSDLRRFLNENAFTIVDEKVVLSDGKYYEIIKVRDGVQRKLSPLELELGCAMQKDKTYRKFIERKIDHLENVLKNRAKSQTAIDNSKFTTMLDEIKKL